MNELIKAKAVNDFLELQFIKTSLNDYSVYLLNKEYGNKENIKSFSNYDKAAKNFIVRTTGL